MSGEAKSSEGVRMFLSGVQASATVKPTAISKANPTVVTAPDPGPSDPQALTLTAITAGAITTFGVSSADLAKIIDDTVTFAGFAGDWAPLNGVQTVVKTADGFTVAVDSSAFSAAPTPGSITATTPGADIIYAIGQIVTFRDTGLAELDDRFFSLKEVGNPAGTITLLGADTSASTGTFNPATAEMDVYDTANMVSACLNNFAFNLETPGTIAAGTYCNPSATLPSAATSPGTATLGGWIDIADPAYVELLKAVDDGEDRVFSILLPKGQGEIVAPMYFTGITWDIPLEGGMAFTANATLQAKPKHLF